MNNDPVEIDELIGEIAEAPHIACPALSVVVDFNDLLADRGDDAYEIVAKLRDLLT